MLPVYCLSVPHLPFLAISAEVDMGQFSIFLCQMTQCSTLLAEVDGEPRRKGFDLRALVLLLGRVS